MKKGNKIYRYIGLAVVVALFLAFSFIPSFLKYRNIISITRQSSMIGICAIGMAMVIIIKHIDLSTGGVMSFCAMLSGICMLSGMNFVLAMMIGLISGTLIGFISGVLVAKIRIPAFIVTFVMGQIAEGAALILGKGKSIGGMSDAYMALGNGSLLTIPYSTLILIVFTVVASIIMTETRLGKHMYAQGGNELSVHQEGINVDRVKYFAFASAGFCSAAAGILLSAQLNTVRPTQGANFQLDAVAACVIGGVSLLGGEGKIWRSVVGAVLIGVLRNIITLVGMHPYYQNLFIGAAIIIVVGVNICNKNRMLEASKVF